MKIIIPPIKSQGIKTKLVPWIMDVAKIAQPKGMWIEPFLGTGVVAFNSGFKSAILNDTNPHIINFYKGIQDGTITPSLVKHYLNKQMKNFHLQTKTVMFISEKFVTDLIRNLHHLIYFSFPVQVLMA